MGKVARVLQKQPRKSHHLSEVTVLERRVQAAEHRASVEHCWLEEIDLRNEYCAWEKDHTHAIKALDGNNARVFTPEEALVRLIAWNVQPWAELAIHPPSADHPTLESAREIMQANEDMRQDEADKEAAKRPLPKQTVKEIVVIRSV